MKQLIELTVYKDGVDAASDTTVRAIERVVTTIGDAFAMLDGYTDDISVVAFDNLDAGTHVVQISLGKPDTSGDESIISETGSSELILNSKE